MEPAPPSPVAPPDASPPSPPPPRGDGRWRRWGVLAILLGTLALDQGTKRLALLLLPFGRRVTLLGGSIRLEHARNEGGFLGLGARLGQDVRGPSSCGACRR